MNFNKEHRNCLIWTLFLCLSKFHYPKYLENISSDFKRASKFKNILIGNFKTSRSFFFAFFPKFNKLNISLIYKAIIVIFRESSYGKYLKFNKFNKKEILIQPPGEPREQHLGDVRPKKFELHTISLKTKWPEGSIYSGALLRKSTKN